MDLRSKAVSVFKETQDAICQALSAADSGREFLVDDWRRSQSTSEQSSESNTIDGGGGQTRVLRRQNDESAVFDSAGVNFSEVHGTLPQRMVEVLLGEREEKPFYATGISLVIHPYSPMIPTVHANFRYLTVGDRQWFGGGADLTPYYLFEEDAIHFHQTWRDACGEEWYQKAKLRCDEYFFLPHRGEARGIGGIFYDYLGKDSPENIEQYFEQTKTLCAAFVPSYLPIVERRRETAWGAAEKEFQLIRRGRYVEFNLLHDRGTQFGIQTNGRTESILMSLPPEVRWEYCFEPEAGSREAALLEVLRAPRDWLS